jgi:hypothetical protein
MKLFKRKFEFNFFGIRIVIMASTYPHGYRRGDKVKQEPVDAEQINLFSDGNLLPRCKCGKLMGLITGGTTDKWYYKCECGNSMKLYGNEV